jgi:hypothetical protein
MNNELKILRSVFYDINGVKVHKRKYSLQNFIGNGNVCCNAIKSRVYLQFILTELKLIENQSNLFSVRIGPSCTFLVETVNSLNNAAYYNLFAAKQPVQSNLKYSELFELKTTVFTVSILSYCLDFKCRTDHDGLYLLNTHRVIIIILFKFKLNEIYEIYDKQQNDLGKVTFAQVCGSTALQLRNENISTSTSRTTFCYFCYFNQAGYTYEYRPYNCELSVTSLVKLTPLVKLTLPMVSQYYISNQCHFRSNINSKFSLYRKRSLKYNVIPGCFVDTPALQKISIPRTVSRIRIRCKSRMLISVRLIQVNKNFLILYLHLKHKKLSLIRLLTNADSSNKKNDFARKSTKKVTVTRTKRHKKVEKVEKVEKENTAGGISIIKVPETRMYSELIFRCYSCLINSVRTVFAYKNFCIYITYIPLTHFVQDKKLRPINCNYGQVYTSINTDIILNIFLFHILLLHAIDVDEMLLSPVVGSLVYDTVQNTTPIRFVDATGGVVCVVFARVVAGVANNSRICNHMYDGQMWTMTGDERDIGDDDEVLEGLKSIYCTWKEEFLKILKILKTLKTFTHLSNNFMVIELSYLDIVVTHILFISEYAHKNKIICSYYTNPIEFDMLHAHKGTRLYALPELANSEHFVLKKIFFNKDVTMSHIRLFLKVLLKVSSKRTIICKFQQNSREVHFILLLPMLKLEQAHVAKLKKIYLENDIETNPGPPGPTVNAKLTIVTLNCRGLGKIDKFRLLLNKAAKLCTKQNAVILLQETMVTDERYVQMAWRGKSVVTPGTGNSKGCITLVNSDTLVENVVHIGHRGHYFTYKHNLEEPIVIFNIYAPNGFNDEKTDFFAEIFDNIRMINTNVIIGGDFNVTLYDSDRHNRGATPGELALASFIKDSMLNLNLDDVWQARSGFTWRKGKTMSKLDRIFTRLTSYNIHSLVTDWTFTTSDHAAVITEFIHTNRIKYKSAHVKLDNDVVKNPELLLELRQYVSMQLADPNAALFDPHAKLEFAKVCIRTKAIDIMARIRKKDSIELKELNRDINENTRLLAIYNDVNSQEVLRRELDLALEKRNEMLQKEGEKLASIAKTKWYNEGERSNKYFLNLLKRQADRNDMSILRIDGTETSNSTQIKTHVHAFYNELYNHNRVTDIANDLFQYMFKVEQPENDAISTDITLEELWRTLKPLKATTPGPDGISNLYLKKLWDIMGPLILDSWRQSQIRGELPVSHRHSILRLIPKAGKDIKELKNWRPITLSNCDHKLITKTYNNRLLNSIKNHITSTQTAYLKGRNISDNLRLVNALTKAAQYNSGIDATVIALDAQKAFDSVNHDYIEKVIENVGLSNFVPIFRLLYRDLENDILINGQLGNKFKIKNGVKQGDALSCSLFILAIEPLIRNIENRVAITPVTCHRLNFTWPKVLAYADDVSIIMNNNCNNVQAAFSEYWKLTKASGLFLNADKTEKFNVHNENIQGTERHVIRYGEDVVHITNQALIKINGVYFSNDAVAMADANAENMINKMNNHFVQWSKRSLSLLGKTQIIKTFGLSQFLYALAIVDLLPIHWKQINNLVAKFLWNRNYAGNRAPNRIKNDIIYNDTKLGGFGMIRLDEVVNCIRLKRFSLLEEGFNHPVRQLQICLGSKVHLRNSSTHNIYIDPTTETATNMISTHNLKAYAEYDTDNLVWDRILRLKLCSTKLVNITPRNKRNCRIAAHFRRIGIYTVHELLESVNVNKMDLLAICKPELVNVLRELLQLEHLDHGIDDIRQIRNHILYDNSGYKWVNCAQLTSRQIRKSCYKTDLITNTKSGQFDPAEAAALYNKISKISSVALRTKILRLVHGDVFCGTKLVRSGLADFDTCIRCFETETINHLLHNCPYSQTVWNLLGINADSLTSILDSSITDHEFEFRCAIVDLICFRKALTPPNKVIENTVNSYARGLSKKKKITEYAASMSTSHQLRRAWF